MSKRERKTERECERSLGPNAGTGTSSLYCCAVTDYVSEPRKNDRYRFHFPSGMTCQAALFDNSMKGVHRGAYFEVTETLGDVGRRCLTAAESPRSRITFHRMS